MFEHAEHGTTFKVVNGMSLKDLKNIRLPGRYYKEKVASSVERPKGGKHQRAISEVLGKRNHEGANERLMVILL